MRRLILLAALLTALLAPACALAAKATGSAGGISATLSYKGGPGITTHDERLTISRDGKVVYDQALPATGCFKVCSPEGKNPVKVADLYGDGSEDVVLTLFSGGADCCTLDDVFVHSSAVSSYVLDQHNFGEAGALLKDIGPHGIPEFVSADPAFYCQFTSCAASGLPLQIFRFVGERFVNVTTQHPTLITADAAKWLKAYRQNLKNGDGLIAAWAADEYNLGRQAAAGAELRQQVAARHLTKTFVASLERFLIKHHYG